MLLSCHMETSDTDGNAINSTDSASFEGMHTHEETLLRDVQIYGLSSDKKTKL